MPTLKYLDPITQTYKPLVGIPSIAGWTSGVWGQGELAKYPGSLGDTLGREVFTDSQGKLRAKPDLIYTQKYAADLPSTYPLGVSLMTLTGGWASTGGWPYASSGYVVTFFRADSPLATNSTSAFQIWNRNVSGSASPAAAEMLFRSGTDSGGWTPWVQLSAATLTELDATVNLNLLTTPGTYAQSQNVEATLALNYPVPNAGMLEVFANTAGDEIWQRYTVYALAGQPGGFTYTRGKYLSTWQPWVNVGGNVDSVAAGSTPTIVTPSATNFTMTSNTAIIRNGICYLYVAGTMKVASSAPGTSGDITNIALGTINAGLYFPGGGPFQYNMSSVGSGRPLSGYVLDGGTVGIGGIGGSTPLGVGEVVSLSGSYPI